MGRPVHQGRSEIARSILIRKERTRDYPTLDQFPSRSYNDPSLDFV
jgi:hypothetical protein